MSDSRWKDVEADIASAVEHFQNAIELFMIGGFDAPGLEGYKNSMAVMHAFQCAHTSAETAFVRILEMLEEEVPVGRDWHAALIRRLSQPMEETSRRPAVISAELASALQATRQLRHVAAHGYEKFDATLAAPSVEAARTVMAQIQLAVAKFRQAIDPY